jgi:dephospho-CoA kinase
VARFGREYLKHDGSLDRPRLGQLVFAQPAERKALEELLHPLIHLEIERQLQVAAQGPAQLAVLDTALLFAMGLDRVCQRTATVEADPEVQIARVAQRDGLPRDQALLRLAAQASQAERRAQADWVIDNNGSLADLGGQVDKLMAALAQHFA